MEVIEIEVKERSELGKAALRKIRQQGQIPAVVYAEGKEATTLMIDTLHFARQTAGKAVSQLYSLKGAEISSSEDSIGLSLIKHIQLEPLKDFVQHVDFYSVTAGTKISLTVPLRLSGECPSVKIGTAILNQIMYEVEVECLPRVIPDEFVLDISALEEGQTLHLSDIPLKEGVVLKTDPSLSVVSALVKKAIEEEAPAAAEEGEATDGAADGTKPAEGDAQPPASEGKS